MNFRFRIQLLLIYIINIIYAHTYNTYNIKYMRHFTKSQGFPLDNWEISEISESFEPREIFFFFSHSGF